MAFKNAAVHRLPLSLAIAVSYLQVQGSNAICENNSLERQKAVCDDVLTETEEAGAVFLQTRRAQVKSRSPNIALIVLDQWRWDYAGFNEPDVSMPTLKELASRGTRFTKSYVPSPLCVPSRTAFAAGRHHTNMWVTTNGVDYIQPGKSTSTFMTLLQNAGYTTMVTGKDHLSAGSGVGPDGSTHASELGFDMFHRTMDKYEFCSAGNSQSMFNGEETKRASFPIDEYGTWLLSQGLWQEQCDTYGSFGHGTACNESQLCSYGGKQCGFNCSRLNPIDENASIDKWVEQQAELLVRKHLSLHGTDKPWFLQVNFPSPHPPFILTDSDVRRTAEKTYPFPVEGSDSISDENTLLHVQRTYAALVEMLDEELGKFVSFLKNAAALDDTVIIVTADHGEHLGDHGEFAKESPWEMSLHVPLVVSGPGIRKQIVERPVSTLDLVATMLELAGTKPAPQMDTQSMIPALTQGRSEGLREVILSSLHGFAGTFESAAKQFNSSSFLRLVCCPTGCIKSGLLLPAVIGQPQIALMHVTPGDGSERHEHDVLNNPRGRGIAEATELMQELSADYRERCLPLLLTD